MIRCVKDLSPELEERRHGLPPDRQGYRFLDRPFEIRSDSPALAGLCEHIYGSFRSSRPSDRAAALYLLEDRRDRETPYRAIDPGFDSFLCSEPGQAVSFSGAQLTCNHLYRLPFLFVHASVLERDGGALVFAGRSGAGKTTFILPLAGEGFSFFSDEFAPFSLAEGKVHPFPRSIFLDRESRSRLPGAAELPYFLDYQEKQPGAAEPPRRYILAPQRVFSAVGSSPAPPAALFILDGFANDVTSGRLLPAGRALELLLELVINAAFIDPAMAGTAVGMLIELLSRIPAYLLRPGPADEDPAARTGLLGELVSGQPAEVEDLAAIGRRCREILEQKYQSIDFTDYRQ